MRARLLYPVLTLVLVVVALETVVKVGWVASYLLPAPTDVLANLWLDHDEFLAGVWSTTWCATAGLALSVFCGFTFACLLAAFRPLQMAVYPYAVFFQTVPVIAIAPLLVIWFGFGWPTVLASAFIVSIFPVIAGSMHGLSATEPALLDLFQIYRASRWQTLWRLRIPAALPYVLAGVRVAAGLAVIGAIVGEFIAGGGLGSIVDAARTQQRVDKVFAAVLLSSILGLFLVGVVEWVGRLLLRGWHASGLQSQRD